MASAKLEKQHIGNHRRRKTIIFILLKHLGSPIRSVFLQRLHLIKHCHHDLTRFIFECCRCDIYSNRVEEFYTKQRILVLCDCDHRAHSMFRVCNTAERSAWGTTQWVLVLCDHWAHSMFRVCNTAERSAWDMISVALTIINKLNETESGIFISWIWYQSIPFSEYDENVFINKDHI